MRKLAVKSTKVPWVQLLIHLIILLFFLKLAYTNWLMINHAVPPGESVGWRTEAVLSKGEEIWYAANEHAGRAIFVAAMLGILSLLIGIVFLLRSPGKTGFYVVGSVVLAVSFLVLGYAYTALTLPKILGGKG